MQPSLLFKKEHASYWDKTQVNEGNMKKPKITKYHCPCTVSRKPNVCVT